MTKLNLDSFIAFSDKLFKRKDYSKVLNNKIINRDIWISNKNINVNQILYVAFIKTKQNKRYIQKLIKQCKTKNIKCRIYKKISNNNPWKRKS